MIDISEVINDPDLMQTFTALRSSGTFGPGGFASTTTTITMSGVVTVAREKDLVLVPEGDRVQGAMVFYSTAEIFVTHADGTTQGASDVLVWKGHTYRVLSVAEYSDYGYYKAIAVRTLGA